MSKLKLSYIILRLVFLGSLCHAGANYEEKSATQSDLDQDKTNLTTGFDKQYSNLEASIKPEQSTSPTLMRCERVVQTTYHSGQRDLNDLNVSLQSQASLAQASANSGADASVQTETLAQTSSSAATLSAGTVADLDDLYGLNASGGDINQSLCVKSCPLKADGVDQDTLKIIGQFRDLCQKERVALRQVAAAAASANGQLALSASTVTNTLKLDTGVSAATSITAATSDDPALSPVNASTSKFPPTTVLAIGGVAAVGAAIALSSHGSKSSASANSSPPAVATAPTTSQMTQASTQANADLQQQCALAANATTAACKSYLNTQTQDGLGTLVSTPTTAPQPILRASSSSLRSLVNSGKLSASSPGAPTK